jgi:hypothetical protein
MLTVYVDRDGRRQHAIGEFAQRERLAAISLQSPGGRDRGGILRGGTVEADAALPVLFNDLTTGAVPCAAK